MDIIENIKQLNQKRHKIRQLEHIEAKMINHADLSEETRKINEEINRLKKEINIIKNK